MIALYNCTVNYCNVILQCALPLHAVVSCLVNIKDLPVKPANGQQNASGTTFGSTVTYSCDTGYKLKGPSTVTCLANGRWNTSGEAVQCIGKSQCILYIAFIVSINLYYHIRLFYK